ncbi:MAG TPA: KEOPS complex subunit Pcc1 [Thermoplasmata archaeon]|nr:KEOPS complex subunit Pcc1 [Thermoplasmata archaeon]
MTEGEFAWSATVQLRVDDPRVADWLHRSLLPEASREVPRAQAQLRRGEGPTVELTIQARDSGAMRAALNTYLGWIHLSLATARTALPAR